MEKIAVHCPTKDIFFKVLKEMDKKGIGIKGAGNGFASYGEETCLRVLGNSAYFGDKPYYQRKGYTIISAQEYLGGRMFKVGDRVECISITGITKECNNKNHCKIGDIYVILNVFDYYNTLGLEGKEFCVEMSDFKLIKENNMKENNINKNVLEVFGDLSAKEVVIIDRHFDDEMLKVIMMKQFSGEIKAACEEAEDKLKEVSE